MALPAPLALIASASAAALALSGKSRIYYHNTSDSDTKSTDPNQHDYDELATIYAHLDSSTTVASGASSGPGHAGDHIPAGVDEHYLPAWASPAAGDVYEVDLPNGLRVVTHVIWIRSSPGRRP